MRPKKACKNCKYEFASDDKRRKYCSWDCYNNYRTGNPTFGYFAGHTPWNKGLKGIHLSPGSEFKKGHKNESEMQVGETTTRIDKSGKKRTWIKVSSDPHAWIEYAKWIWIKENGPIPKSLLVHHLDKDSMNDDVDNLALVSRKTHINLHREDLLNGKKLRGIRYSPITG